MISASAAVPWAIPAHSVDTIKDGFFPPQTTWNNSSAWGTANRAIYVPVRFPRRVVVRKLGAGINTTGAGNIDIGIYDAAGTRLVSTGSTAKGTTETVQVIDVTDTTIGPGLHYLALNNSTTTDTFVTAVFTAPGPTAFGVMTQAVGAITLPATATFALTHTLGFIPCLSALLVTEVA